MRIREILVNARKILKENHIEDGGLIAKVLLAHILSCKKEELIVNSEKELEIYIQEKYLNSIEKITNGYPLQYLTGKQEFMKMEFMVDENVLIPRSDTEILVEETINQCKDNFDVLDLCTGSGAIGISIAKYLPKVNVMATDISERALNIAKINAKHLLEEQNISFTKSNMFENINNKFNIIVSNPPYIKKDTIKDYSLKFEPELALNRRE